MKKTMSDILKLLVKSETNKIHTCIPAVIEKYNAGQRKANVKPVIGYRNNEENIEYPIITNVPVVFPSSGKVTFTFELSRGDGVLLLFSERSLENWINVSQQKVIEEDERRFALSDAIAIPGLFDFKNVSAGVEKGLGIDAEEIVVNNGENGVARKGDSVKLDMTQADIVNLATALLATGAFTPTGNPPAPSSSASFTEGEITSGSNSVKIG